MENPLVAKETGIVDDCWNWLLMIAGCFREIPSHSPGRHPNSGSNARRNMPNWWPECPVFLECGHRYNMLQYQMAPYSAYCRILIAWGLIDPKTNIGTSFLIYPVPARSEAVLRPWSSTPDSICIRGRWRPAPSSVSWCLFKTKEVSQEKTCRHHHHHQHHHQHHHHHHRSGGDPFFGHVLMDFNIDRVFKLHVAIFSGHLWVIWASESHNC